MKPIFWEKWSCPCKQNHFLVKTDRDMNHIQFFCITCETTVKCNLISIEYSA